jgi:hypothetical protein
MEMYYVTEYTPNCRFLRIYRSVFSNKLILESYVILYVFWLV